ncbi:MAG: hypothetical protein WBS20_00825, partial [Lysobacterales bacterium]
MNKPFIIALMTASLFLLADCEQEQQAVREAAPVKETVATAPAPHPHVVEIRAVGKTFQGPQEIPSGWTTFKFVNASGMIHFAMIDVPPEGITAGIMSEALMQPFQDAMDGLNAGDGEAVNAAFARFPAWIGELSRNGGPGLLSPGLSGQATVYLDPGHYVLECYVKSDGVFHTTSPGEGLIGMMLDMVVTDTQNNAPEPTANVTLSVTNSGFELTGGTLRPGRNTIRVNFIEQQAFPSFVGNDVHLMKVENDDSVALADGWLDWRTKDGLEDPAPVTFLGGLNDMPAGSHGYFSVDLEPGDYAFIAEMPGP